MTWYTRIVGITEWDQGSVRPLPPSPLHQNLPPGNISRAEQAVGFHIYYGQSFKVIKNAVDSKSYLLIQGSSRMATRTKYCTTRIKSFVIPLANFSAGHMSFPVSFFELLGLLKSMKGITSDSIASNANTNQPQACNFATFSPQIEDSALQKAEWIKYIGVFANLELRANQVYDQVKENYMTLDEFQAILCTVEVVIDETYTADPVAYNLSSFVQNTGLEDVACLGFLTSKSLWRYDKRSQRIHWEEGVVSINEDMCNREADIPLNPTIILVTYNLCSTDTDTDTATRIPQDTATLQI
ncbi:unnamed protein product [Rhodiola kirilowii]